jgi:iron complex transport system ATP-binding protein
MRDVGCLDWSDRWVSELSDGEKQRVFLARVLAQGTEVLLLDEPTAFIDLPQRIEIAKVLKRWAREAGRGVVLSTHDLDLAMATADRIWMLESGGVWTSGIPEELVMSGSLGRVFESNDATIDRSSGRLVWCLPGGRPIAVSGDGPWLDWTIRALVRSGYRIDSKSVARVEVRLAGGQTSWEARKEEASIQAASLGELLAALRESYPAEENVSG